VHGLAMEAGTQQLIVAAIGDEAGNVGRTTNTIAMTVVTNAGYSYDLAGNITNIAYTGYRTLQLKWDGQYRLLSVSTNGTSIESNRYDALGRRISVRNGTNTTYFVYDGLHIVAEVGTSGSLLYSYTYGPGIDNILSMTAYGSTTTTYYYIKDHLGTVAAIADGSGNIVESYRYDAWGRVSVFDTAGQPLTESAVGNRFLFQGREYSWSTGLYYFRARWYDPITGRWLSNDPIGIGGGLNQYVFAGNNSVNVIDPLGLYVGTSSSPHHWNWPWDVWGDGWYTGAKMVGYYRPNGQAGLLPQDIGPQAGGALPCDWEDEVCLGHDRNLAGSSSVQGVRHADSRLQVALFLAPFRHPLTYHKRRARLVHCWSAIPAFTVAHPVARIQGAVSTGDQDPGHVVFIFFDIDF